ncbi:HNH endonuclease family protein [Salinifilum ghardaiensis]
MRLRTTAVATALAAVPVLAGCSLPEASQLLDRDTEPAAPSGDVSAARAALDELPVRPEGSLSGYERDEFDVWASQGDGCDTRAELLKHTSSTPAETNEHCTVQSGTWRGAYTGQTITDASEVDVDHLVPLAEAWRSGANSWPERLREQFGNDLAHGNLVVAESSTNSEKSDQDPAKWMPPQERCGYAADYVLVTAHWNEQAQQAGGELSLDQAEHDALQRQLEQCAGGGGQ